MFNSIYSSVSPDFRFKETPYVNFYTDPELSSSLYHLFSLVKLQLMVLVEKCSSENVDVQLTTMDDRRRLVTIAHENL